MSVWVAIPSARPVPEVQAWAERWHAQGYKIALWRDTEDVPGVDMCTIGAYPGYAVAANTLIADVLAKDPSCDWVVCCGDDTWPDPNKRAEEIAAECSRYFARSNGEISPFGGLVWHSFTFGVMQPTGDDWSDHMGRIIERIAGSPWIGREYALRINQGRGPWHNEYFHNWADQEMQEVATMLGVFWQRRDVCQFHDHCCRYPGGKWAPHLQHVSADYDRMKPLFEKRKREGFPGSEPL